MSDSSIDDSGEVIPLLPLCVFQESSQVLTLFYFGCHTSAGSDMKRWLGDLCV